MNREIFLASKMIKFEEGLRLKPYYCSEGFPTIGWGELLGKKGEALPDITWTEEQAENALNDKILKGVSELSTNKGTKPAWDSLGDDTDRKAILISMWYQLGITNLAAFKDTLKSIVEKDFKKTAEEMLDSDVARRVAYKRWKRQSTAMEKGDVLSTYKF